MIKTKKELVIIGIILLMVIALIGVSWAVFNYSAYGTKVNTITTGAITMTYVESSNTISLNGALPTTDTTGYQRLNDGEYFDFSVTTNIQGKSYINYEITAKALDGNSIDGKYIKLYLSKINDDGSESNVTPIQYFVGTSGSGITGVPTYSEELTSNEETGRPAGEMSLTTGTIYQEGEVTTNYRLRMWVSEGYNPQGNGGGKTFSVKVNVYGKNEAGSVPMLKSYNSSNQEDFHTSNYKSNITSIVTKGDTIIPEDAIESWDMSLYNDGSVVAYLEDDGTGEGKYKLTLGGTDKIYANTDMSRYFRDFTSLKTIDLSYLDTSNTTNMYQLFFNCKSLTELDLSPLNTASVTNMSNMFSYCSSLTELDLTPLNTANVTNMSAMFYYCSSLTKINLSTLNTSKVTTMRSMFNNCSSLVQLDLNNFYTHNVTDMCVMFSNCSNLIDLDLSNFDTSNVTTMDGMFMHCSNLTNINVSSFNTSKVNNMGSISGQVWESAFGEFDTTYLGMFGDCTSLKTLDLRNFDTRNVTNMWAMFYNTPNLTEVLVDQDKWSTSQADTSHMFENSGVSAVTFG